MFPLLPNSLLALLRCGMDYAVMRSVIHTGSVTYGDINHVHAATTLGSMPNPYAGYDAMGNMTCRNTDTTSGHTCGSSPTGALMSYDNEGRLASWTAPSGTTATDGFLYDNEGNRVLQRVNTTNVTDTITFDGYSETVLSGGTITPTKYYNINGQRVAMRTNSTLSYLLSDVLGSSTIALTSTGSTQAVQLFAPYGAIRYSQGTMPTTYNFTGQRLDSQTGLLYYNFRYYDPVSGRFVRADTTQTNAGGMDPYAYVGNNPEGRTDPTGHCWPWCTALIGAAVGAVIGVAVTTVTSYATTGKPPSGGELLQAAVSGAVSGAIVGLLGPGASVVGAIGIGALTGAAGGVAGRLAYNGVTGKSWSAGLVQAGVEGAVIGGLTGGVFKAAAPLLGRVGRALADGSCSFTPDTPVTTDHGKRSIGKLRVGNEVLAYNPKTQKMEPEPILHVWIHADNDLIDITIATVSHSPSHKVQVSRGEVLHTTSEHPFLTLEKGFLPAGHLSIGMHILRADGGVGIIIGWKIVPGTMVMYNLEVAHDHTFTVGDGQWIVHNMCPSSIVPRIVRFLGGQTDNLRATLPPRMTFGGPSTPNVASISVSYLTDDGSGQTVWDTFRSIGNRFPRVQHAEPQALAWASSQIQSLAATYGEGDVTVRLVTQYNPCPGSCFLDMSGGVWQSGLDTAAGGNVDFQVWHYDDWGNYHRIY